MKIRDRKQRCLQTPNPTLRDITSMGCSEPMFTTVTLLGKCFLIRDLFRPNNVIWLPVSFIAVQLANAKDGNGANWWDWAALFVPHLFNHLHDYEKHHGWLQLFMQLLPYLQLHCTLDGTKLDKIVVSTLDGGKGRDKRQDQRAYVPLSPFLERHWEHIRHARFVLFVAIPSSPTTVCSSNRDLAAGECSKFRRCARLVMLESIEQSIRQYINKLSISLSIVQSCSFIHITLSSKGLIKRLIVHASCARATWFPDHAFIRKWLLLTNPGDTAADEEVSSCGIRREGTQKWFLESEDPSIPVFFFFFFFAMGLLSKPFTWKKSHKSDACREAIGAKECHLHWELHSTSSCILANISKLLSCYFEHGERRR